MNRNVLVLVIGVLVLAAGYLGYRVYEDQHRSGVDISIGGRGVSIRER